MCAKESGYINKQTGNQGEVSEEGEVIMKCREAKEPCGMGWKLELSG